MRGELEQTVGRIAGAHGDVHWNPLIYQSSNLGFEEIVAFYRLCDVALITPLRDGMKKVGLELVLVLRTPNGVLTRLRIGRARRKFNLRAEGKEPTLKTH